MSAAVISTLIFASPGASAFSGSRTDLRGATSPGHAQAANPSADYWHALAVKRLHLAGYFERKRNQWRAMAKRLRAGLGEGHRQSVTSRRGSPATIICSVFGSHCREAISVATCESHLNVYARNPAGYWGLFQFGAFARAHYGFAWDALTQARAAYRYFQDAGGWSPWQCKP